VEDDQGQALQPSRKESLSCHHNGVVQQIAPAMSISAPPAGPDIETDSNILSSSFEQAAQGSVDDDDDESENEDGDGDDDNDEDNEPAEFGNIAGKINVALETRCVG